MKNLFKSKKGFTLVEIVIVIAIIGLLMIILIPSAINAFKNNRLQGAKIKAQRVASQMEAGIGSGKLPLSAGNAQHLGINLEEDGIVLLTEATEPTDVANIAGIKNLYNLPTNNQDLIDPLATGTGTQSPNFRVTWDSTQKQVFIYNSEKAVNADTDTGDVVYGSSERELENPVEYDEM